MLRWIFLSWNLPLRECSHANAGFDRKFRDRASIMGEMSWSRRFDEPIKMPDGKTLRTLQDAAKYVLALPPNVQKEPAWQAAAECLTNAAEREIAWMWFARPAMCARC